MSHTRPEKIPFHEVTRLAEVLDGFCLAKKTIDVSGVEDSPIQKHLADDVKDEKSDILLTNQCLTCKCDLLEREDQLVHYKSDWHRYNIKLRLIGQHAISEEEFGDAEDVLSISGSDSDEEEMPNHTLEMKRDHSTSILKPNEGDESGQHNEQFDNRMPKLYFKNSNDDTVSIYKKVLYSRQNSDVDDSITDLALKTLQAAHDQLWLIMLLSAGHFAAAVFQGSNILVHKTFHRYVVRAKRGTVQSINDSKGGNAKKGVSYSEQEKNNCKIFEARSAGASIRRHNEAALEESIRSLLKAWKKEYVDKCSHIFLRIPQYRKAFFYGGKEPLLEQKDIRIRSVPFITRRPTFNEVKRIHQELYSVTLHGKLSMTDVMSPLKPSPKASPIMGKKKDKKEKKKSSPPPVESISSDSAPDDMELVLAEQSNDTQELKTFHCPSSAKRKKKKKRRNVDKYPSHDQNPDGAVNDVVTKESTLTTTGPLSHLSPAKREIMHRLYTTCKSSNAAALNVVIQEIQDQTPTTENGIADDETSQESIYSLESYLSTHLDSSGNTLLHVAARSGNVDVIDKLLEGGADPSLTNFTSLVPYCSCSDKKARNQFRRFRARYPDRYDYKKAQIPSPLSQETEEMMKKKQAEKKKAQKAAKKEKEKRLKEEEEMRQAEQSEKDRFLALSDREKRLIAVERRMMNQPIAMASSSRRCYICADNLFAKVPFEYMDFQFCSMKCLKEHKSKNRS